MSGTVFTAEQIAAGLRDGLKDWQSSGGQLVRRYQTPDWRASLLLVGAIGYLAELRWHHPDLVVSFSSVEVRLSSHDAGGITAQDFDLARRIEALSADPVPHC